MNNKDDKYYYINPTVSYLKSLPRLLRWNPYYMIEVDENVDYHQYISIDIDKLKNGAINSPKSTKWEKVQPVIKEVFLNHYSLAVKYIYEALISEGEFYIQNS